LILAYQGLEKENLDQKSPGPPGWGLVQQASRLLIEKKKFAKKPIGKGLMEEDWNDRSNWRKRIV
jgi:hypothetical protein